MRLKKAVPVVGVVVLIGGFGTAALAASTVNKTSLPANGTAAERTVTVSWTGQPAGDTIFIQQCFVDGNKPGVVFDPFDNCSGAVGKNPPSGPTGSGSETFTLFSGDDPNESGFACGPGPTAALSTGTVINPCFIRVVPSVRTNLSADEFFPITFTADPDPVVPEVPLNVLLPLSAAAVLGGGYAITRKRRLNAAA